jgi:hypothetical protein
LLPLQNIHSDLVEAIKSFTGTKHLIYTHDFVLWYETPKLNAEAKTKKPLNDALDVLAKWCDTNRLIINTVKTAFQSSSPSHQSNNPDLKYEETPHTLMNMLTWV